jgi:uncharacterized spore protein YtfJ
MDTPEVLAQLADRLTKYQVLGAPYERDGVTVIPVMHVRAGGGIGGRRKPADGDRDGGLGMVCRPAGAWVIKDGNVSWQPALNLNHVILGGQTVGIVALLVVYRLLRRRLG